MSVTNQAITGTTLRKVSQAAQLQRAVWFGCGALVVLTGLALPAKQLNRDSELAQCQANMKRIFKAAEAYKKDTGDWPKWLSDLVPMYLSDTSVLVCPSYSRAIDGCEFASADPKLPTSYLYAFDADNREFTSMQLKRYPDRVPLIRCLWHEHVQTISDLGAAYASGLDWTEDLPGKKPWCPDAPQPIYKWGAIGGHSDGYLMGLDLAETFKGEPVGFIRSEGDQKGKFGGLVQTFDAGAYKSKRVRMSGWMKTQDVTDGASLWIRIDGREPNHVGFDNMEDLHVKGSTDWTKYDLVVQAKDSSETVFSGVFLSGAGKLWFRDIEYAPVADTVPLTGAAAKPWHAPEVHEFSEYMLVGDDYENAVETETPSTNQIMRLSSKTASPKGAGKVVFSGETGPYLGRTVRFSAMVKTEEVKELAGIWFRPSGSWCIGLTSDFVQDPPLRGSTDWRMCEVTLRMPAKLQMIDDQHFCLGLVLKGPGKVWMKNPKLGVTPSQMPSNVSRGS